MTEADGQTDPRALPPSESWRELLHYRKRGVIEPHSLANTLTLLRHHPQWRGVFAFDEFSGEVLVHQCPPWQSEDSFRVHEVTQSDIVHTAAALEFNGLACSIATATHAISTVARDYNKIHPVRDYFDRLQWDGEPRLGTWLKKYLNATDQDPNYLGPIGEKWLTAGARRIYQPGAKFDFMLVLEGEQNIGKSLALRTLSTFGDPGSEISYFTDGVKFENITHPSSIMALQGRLIVEFAELSGMNRKEIEEIKHWITIQSDVLQKKYENATTEYPRQFILAGTTNEEAWLRDPTGNRRFMPVKCKGRINIDALRRDCNQLWAEAVFRHKEGMVIYVEHGSDLETLSSIEQAGRMIDDVWTDSVLGYVSNIREVTISEILQGIPVEAGRRDEVASRRISRILRAAGWERGQRWVNGRNQKIWRNPNPNFRPIETRTMEFDGD